MLHQLEYVHLMMLPNYGPQPQVTQLEIFAFFVLCHRAKKCGTSTFLWVFMLMQALVWTSLFT